MFSHKMNGTMEESVPWVSLKMQKIGSGGIRTHASYETGALNQRLRPLGHATIRWLQMVLFLKFLLWVRMKMQKVGSDGIWTHASNETGA